MLNALVVSLVMSAPSPPPAIDRPCTTSWARAKAPAAPDTDRCLDFVLAASYGTLWDTESLSSDPAIRGLLTVEVPSEALTAMVKQIDKVCGGKDGELPPRPATQGAAARLGLDGDEALDSLWSTRCERAREVAAGELAAKLGIGDDVNMPDTIGVYQDLFAGTALADDALLPHLDDDGKPLACYSRATLWKFRNAPYARHGKKFKSEDLNRFFFAKRKTAITNDMGERVKLLPLAEGTLEKVELTPADNKNVALVIKAQKACYGE